ncbi:MAG: HD-GYP domain-containing protein [Gammaproteobacteria bacterium]|nr:HD-GYP domain-containing protein [Gammaproteobacteria bacterium]
MATTHRQIEVGLLRVGMYVSKLDRPWLETPFLFQGFCIRNENEIEELQRYCEFVEIDIEQSDASVQGTMSTPATGARLGAAHGSASKKFSLWRRFLNLFRKSKQRTSHDERQPGQFYQDTVSTADELVVARTVYTGMHGQLISFLDGVRRGATVTMPDLAIVTGELVDSVLRNGTAMALLARMQQRDEHQAGHSLATSIWALVFGRHLGLDHESLTAAGLGALLLDIGKMKLPPELLNKAGPLTDVEWAHVQSHVEHSLTTIKEAGNVDQRVLDMVATHHERFNGSGYPKGLKGTQIPVFGRIAGIVDSYTAITSDRPYAAAKSSYDAMREFKAAADVLFQAEMVEQFIQAIGIFPAGTLVELNTGEVGVVLKEQRSARLQPKIAVILDADKNRLEKSAVLDLYEQSTPEPTVWIERGIEPGAYDVDPDEYFL